MKRGEAGKKTYGNGKKEKRKLGAARSITI
jgi:hypothetical protein